MTYRGVYRDGVIVPSQDLDLPEGSRVSFDLASDRVKSTAKRKPRARTKKKTAKKRMTADERVKAFMVGFGIDKDRPDWKGRSTVDIAAELRVNALGDRVRG